MDYLSVSTNEKQSITNEITKENQEISDLCRVLKENNQKLKTIAFEWQRFGQYTAALLQNEVLVFESKIKILTENLHKLSQENAELNDLCLFLNQLLGNSEHTESIQPPVKLSTSQVEDYPSNAACTVELNKVLDDIPLYDTRDESVNPKISVERTNNDHPSSLNEPKSYVNQLEKRLERLEKEKLELIKSLTAIRLLSANDETSFTPYPDLLPPETQIEEPPCIKEFLEFIKTNKKKNSYRTSPVEKQKHELSADEITKLSTLIDISSKLDDLQADDNFKPSNQETKEIAILRALITITFQQLQSPEETLINKQKIHKTQKIIRTAV